MHLKAIFPLLMLSCLFLPSNCFVQNSYFVANDNLDPNERAVSITVGSSSLFALTSKLTVYGFNTATKATIVNNQVYTFLLSYAVVGDTAYLSSQSTIASAIYAFNLTSGLTSKVPGTEILLSYRSLSSVGQNVYIAGGQTYDNGLVEVNTLGIYDTVTKTTTNVTMPFSRRSLTSVPVGNYILFAGGKLGNDPKTDVTIFDVNTRTFTPTASMTMNSNTQGVSIGRFAILINGNVADVFDSSSNTWTTHTLSQSAPVFGFQNQFAMVKNDRYVFIVAGGVADVFDSTSQTWSTLNFAPTAINAYCPSTIVNNYALFGCYNTIYIIELSTFEVTRSVGLGAQLIGADAVGDIATFLTYSGKVNVNTMDFSNDITPPVAAPQLVSPTPVAVTLSSHQLSETRTSYTITGNYAVFISDDISVDIYNSASNTWTTSTPSVTTRAGLLAPADSFVVFTDATSESLIHVLDLSTLQWSVVSIQQDAGLFYITVGNYLFFATSTSSGVLAYNLVNGTWNSLPIGNVLGSVRDAHAYLSYAIFSNPDWRFFDAVALDTENNLAASDFFYGGESRLSPTIAPVGDYLVIAGGYGDAGNSRDFRVSNRVTGYDYVGTMPNAHYHVTVYVVDRLVFIIANGQLDYFNMETQQWTSNSLEQDLVSLTGHATVSGHKLFGSDGAQLIAFDSQTTKWYNITFVGGLPIGQLTQVADLTVLLNTDSVIVYNPSGDQWTRSTFTGKQFKNIFAVGDKAAFLSIDGQTVDTVALSALTSTSTPPVTPPTTPPASPPTTVPVAAPVTPPVTAPVTPPVSAPVATPVAVPVAAPVTGVSSVNPTDDATVRNGIYANDNYALEATMYIKYSTNPDFTRQIYVKFPLNNLLPVGTSRAVVRLLGYYQSTLGPLNVQCYAVQNNAWTQSSITWNNKPALGALLSSTDIIHPIAYYEWDVTSYVASQQSLGATSVSFAFVRNTPGPDESTVLINSKEADVNRPILAITN